MSCERTWWDYVGSVNAHVTAIGDLARHARHYAGMSEEDDLLLTFEEVNEFLDLIDRAQRTLRAQQDQLEAYYRDMQGHGKFATGCATSRREHDL